MSIGAWRYVCKSCGFEFDFPDYVYDKDTGERYPVCPLCEQRDLEQQN